MYNVISISICVISTIYAIARYKKLCSPIIAFNAIWALILSLESLHLYGLCVSETRIYFLIMIGIISFNIGFYLWNRVRQNHRIFFKVGRYGSNVSIKTNYIPRYELLYVIGILCILYYIGSAISTIRYLLAGTNMGEVRTIVQSTVANTNGSVLGKILNAFAVIFIVPSSLAIQAVGVMDFWFGKKDKRLFTLAVILACISSLGEGGRTAIVNLTIYMIVGYALSGVHIKKQKLDTKAVVKKRKKIIVKVMLVAIVVLTWFTLSRVGQTLLKNLYLCFSMQPYMFNLWANKVDAENLYGYTEASLNGFSFTILYIIKNLLGMDFPKHWKAVYEIIRATDSEWQIITNISTRANAYVSIFWFFYLDGRAIGVVLGLFFYGVYMARSFVEAMKAPNIKYATVFAFAFQGMIYTFIRFPFSNIYYSIAYLMLAMLIFRREKS